MLFRKIWQFQGKIVQKENGASGGLGGWLAARIGGAEGGKGGLPGGAGW